MRGTITGGTGRSAASSSGGMTSSVDLLGRGHGAGDVGGGKHGALEGRRGDARGGADGGLLGLVVDREDGAGDGCRGGGRACRGGRRRGSPRRGRRGRRRASGGCGRPGSGDAGAAATGADPVPAGAPGIGATAQSVTEADAYDDAERCGVADAVARASPPGPALGPRGGAPSGPPGPPSPSRRARYFTRTPRTDWMARRRSSLAPPSAVRVLNAVRSAPVRKPRVRTSSSKARTDEWTRPARMPG